MTNRAYGMTLWFGLGAPSSFCDLGSQSSASRGIESDCVRAHTIRLDQVAIQPDRNKAVAWFIRWQ